MPSPLSTDRRVRSVRTGRIATAIRLMGLAAGPAAWCRALARLINH